MHFWIDKRSQACGFGRARVAASLSGGGGVGLGFGGPPRRMGGKSLVAPIHRFQTSDCPRPPHIANTNSNNNSNNNSSSQNNNRNRNSGGGGVGTTQNQHHQEAHHHQTGHIGGNIIGRHQSSANSTTNSHNLQRSNIAATNNQECHIPVPLPHLYGNSSHAQDLEQGALGISTMPARSTLTGVASISNNGVVPEAPESQLLPSHLKCGMWASLVLASVFVAGAKFYFDHQGTGLEVLIFCAFSATFFLAACTVSLCRLPRDLATSPSASVDGHSRGLDGTAHHQNNAQHQLFSQTQDQDQDHTLALQSGTTTAPPPPYHIAILLPENTKELQPDETPPPSYDKILI